MNIAETTKRLGSRAAFILAILLVPAYQATAQIRITVKIPELPKVVRTEKTAAPAATTPERPPVNSGEPGKVPSAVSSPGPQSDPRLEILLEEIEKKKKEVETFDPAER